MDLATGQVEFIGVRTHWLTGRVLAVPMLHAELREDVRIVRLPYATDTIKQAPRFALHGTLNDEQKTAIYEHYR